MIKFYRALDLEEKVREMVTVLGLKHIDLSRVRCMRSTGSSAKRTLARCYALGKIWQKALNIPAHYIIEVISERWEKMSEAERERTLLHEIMHIPHAFGGGFRHHKPYVNHRTVGKLYSEYLRRKGNKQEGSG